MIKRGFNTFMAMMEEIPLHFGIYKVVGYKKCPGICKDFMIKKGRYYDVKNMKMRGEVIRNGVKNFGKYVSLADISKKADAEEYCKILNPSFEKKLYPEDKVRLTVEEFLSFSATENIPMFIVDDDEERVGTMNIKLSENIGTIELSNISLRDDVKRDWMKKGCLELADIVFDESRREEICCGIIFTYIVSFSYHLRRIMCKNWEVDVIPIHTSLPNVPKKKMMCVLVQPIRFKKKELKVKHYLGILDDMLSYFQLTKSSKVAIVAFFCGLFFMFGVWLAVASSMWNLGLGIINLTVYHFFEFIIYDVINPEDSDVNSFCIDSKTFLPGFFLFFTEYFVEFYFGCCIPSNLIYKTLVILAFIISPFLILLQNISKLTLGKSFTYYVATDEEKKSNSEDLVTHGLYSCFRHPRYFFFYYWGITVCLIFLNPICLALYVPSVILLYKKRIKEEEGYLIGAYGKEYEEYSERVKIWIPFL